MMKGVGLEYETHGEGQLLLLIHGGFLADAFRPMMSQPCLRDYRLLRYHRRGHIGSDPIPGAFSIADQAGDAVALLQHLDEGRSHVIGHSYGGAVALQMALDAPHVVGSLILLEPAIYHCVYPQLGEPMARAIARHGDSYQSGDPETAVDGFMAGVGGQNWRADADGAMPGSSAQAIRDAGTFFEVENDAHTEWRTFNKKSAARIAQPVLYVIGGDNMRFMEPVADVFKSWIPQTEAIVIPKANHSLHYLLPGEVAKAIHEFVSRHPL